MTESAGDASTARDGAPLRGGVIGFGKMGLLHAGLINVIGSSRLAAICEPNPIMLHSLKNYTRDVGCYRSYKSMLDKEDLDFVFVTTPPVSHIPIGLECVERGIPFFVEKPLCVRSEEAAPLVSALKEKPLTNMVGFMMRYQRTFKKAREILRSGVLGRPLSVNATMYVAQMFAAGKGWRFVRSESGGGSLISQAVHVLDLLVWFFGAPAEVNARTASPYSAGVEDFGHVMLQWPDGLMGSLDSSWSMDNHRLLDTRIVVTTDLGTLIVDDDYVRTYVRNPEYGKPGVITELSGVELFEGAAVDIGGTHFTHQDEDFVRAVATGSQLECDVESGHQVQQVVDAIYASAEERGMPKSPTMHVRRRRGLWNRIRAWFRR